ncbi:MAG: ATPase [Epsilonproteobacteria bacterium]|nr:ATPase [Campylobacterota bacterium]
MLDLNIGVMLIEAGIFLITLVLLKKWLFDPLVKFMDEREKKLEEELEMINKNSHESEEIQKEIEEILSLAKDDARRIVQEARQKAISEAERIKSLKQKEIEEAKEALRDELEIERKKLLDELLKSKDEFKTLVENKIRNAA